MFEVAFHSRFSIEILDGASMHARINIQNKLESTVFSSFRAKRINKKKIAQTFFAIHNKKSQFNENEFMFVGKNESRHFNSWIKIVIALSLPHICDRAVFWHRIDIFYAPAFQVFPFCLPHFIEFLLKRHAEITQWFLEQFKFRLIFDNDLFRYAFLDHRSKDFFCYA